MMENNDNNVTGSFINYYHENIISKGLEVEDT